MLKAVFLDRDGVIQQEPPYYPHKLHQLKLIDHSTEAIKLLNTHKFKVVVISNQSGIARGYFPEKDVKKFNEALKKELKKKNAYIDAVYYCPHHPKSKILAYRKNCECRKPKPGMILQAAQELDINLQQSFMVGDEWRDIQAGFNAGCKTILIRTKTGIKQPPQNQNKFEVDFIAKNLYEAVTNFILK